MEIPEKYLSLIRTRQITKCATAKALNLPISFVYANTAILGPGPVKAEREAKSRLAATRRQHRMRLAKQVAVKKLSLHAAAQEAGCSLRTMYRYLKALP